MIYGIIGFVLGGIFSFGLLVYIVSRQDVKDDRRTWEDDDEEEDDD